MTSPQVRAALVLVSDQRIGRSVVRSIERRGHLAIRVASIPEALSRSTGPDVTVVVVDADACPRQEWVDFTLALARLRPGVRVLVGHADSNLEAMWQVFRCGAIPWVIPTGGQHQLDLPPFDLPCSTSPDLAMNTLSEELDGHHSVACSLLAQIADRDVDAAVEALIATGAAALVQLRDRARFPAPVEVLRAHLPEHRFWADTEAIALWWAMVEATAFRASGLRLDPPEQNGNRDALFGAFHSTATIVRFTARRRWRRPVDVLHEHAYAGSTRSRPESDHLTNSLKTRRWGHEPAMERPLVPTAPDVTG